MTFDIRKLNVGDFLWVAREKVTPVPGKHIGLPPLYLHLPFVFYWGAEPLYDQQVAVLLLEEIYNSPNYTGWFM